MDEFGEKLLEELDYLQEARNIQVILSYRTSMSRGPAVDIQVILSCCTVHGIWICTCHTDLAVLLYINVIRLLCDSCWVVKLAQHLKE